MKCKEQILSICSVQHHAGFLRKTHFSLNAKDFGIVNMLDQLIAQLLVRFARRCRTLFDDFVRVDLKVSLEPLYLEKYAKF